MTKLNKYQQFWFNCAQQLLVWINNNNSNNGVGILPATHTGVNGEFTVGADKETNAAGHMADMMDKASYCLRRYYAYCN